MADIKYYDVIKKPVITEKSMNAMAEKKYTFLVHPEANKSQIKEAVEKMFEGTKVKSVNTMNMDGKKKRRKETDRYRGCQIYPCKKIRDPDRRASSHGSSEMSQSGDRSQ